MRFRILSVLSLTWIVAWLIGGVSTEAVGCQLNSKSEFFAPEDVLIDTADAVFVAKAVSYANGTYRFAIQSSLRSPTGEPPSGKIQLQTGVAPPKEISPARARYDASCRPSVGFRLDHSYLLFLKPAFLNGRVHSYSGRLHPKAYEEVDGGDKDPWMSRVKRRLKQRENQVGLTPKPAIADPHGGVLLDGLKALLQSASVDCTSQLAGGKLAWPGEVEGVLWAQLYPPAKLPTKSIGEKLVGEVRLPLKQGEGWLYVQDVSGARYCLTKYSLPEPKWGEFCQALRAVEGTTLSFACPK